MFEKKNLSGSLSTLKYPTNDAVR